MRAFGVAVLGLTAVVAACAPPAQPVALTGPLAEAAQGKLQCYTPNIGRKTCRALAGYRLDGRGGIESTGSALIRAKPLLVMESVSPVVIRNGNVCGTITFIELDTAKFYAQGKPADPLMVDEIKTRVKAFYAPIMNKELCTNYIPDKGGFVAASTVDGVEIRALDQRVIWVRPEDGYRVGP